MTLNDLILKATSIANQFSSGGIKIYHGDQEVWFDLEPVAPKRASDNWIIKIVNYREGQEYNK